MAKIAAIFVVGAALLFSGAAWAVPTAQQNCDYARITAWKAYKSCLGRITARGAKQLAAAPYAASANCRHAYFQKWTAFQNPNRVPSLAGSTCIGARFVDNGDGTVTDHLSALVWEKKTNLDEATNSGDPHDADNAYDWWSAFTSFLVSLNETGFAGHYDWRVPAIVELQTIVLDFRCSGDRPSPRCTCPSLPCVDLALDPANTAMHSYWSDTISIRHPGWAWNLLESFVTADPPGSSSYRVRAVRGGL